MNNENINIYNIPLDLLENLNLSSDNVIELYEEVKILANNIHDVDSFFE